MRVATARRVVQADPGSTVDIVVDVVNTGDVIEGVTAQLIGLPGATTDVEPKVLPLFPAAEGQLTLSVAVPPTQPAGSHPVTVEVVSHAAEGLTRHVDVDLSVSAQPAVRLGRTPHTVRARRSGRFVLDVVNTGNTALDVALASTIEDSRTTARFNPTTLRVEPGSTVPVILTLKGPRMFTGAEIDRTAAINLTARRTNVISAMQETEQEPELTAATVVVLRQRPTVSRGVLTALVLATIIGLWAAVFLLGLTQVLSGDPLTKTAPASFFPASAETATTGDAAAEGSGGAAAGGAAGGADAAPAGTVSKDGLLPPGVGGEISGTVIATSNGLPVPRILVEAYRDGREGPVLVSSAATQADGTYSLAGLFPTSYRLRFSAEGFTPVWHPAAKARAGSQPVAVAARGKVQGIDAVVEGAPASITGSIDAGTALFPPVTTVTARPLDILTPEGEPSGVVATATSSADGAYTLTDLPAPATYELAFTSEGYAVKKVLTTVSGGEQRLQPSVVPSSADGSISGMVRDGREGLGGVTVTTTVNGQAVSVVTPTVGAVGSFTIPNLPTPGTYVLTFTSASNGAATQIVDLAAGAARDDVAATLIEGTGSVTGKLLDRKGDGLGNVTVTVGGAGTTGTTAPGGTGESAVPTATTLTTGEIGTYSISGLQAPGEYTLTFTLEGYAPQSVPVSLSASGVTEMPDVVLGTEYGVLRGVVTGPEGGFVGATVTATDGRQIWKVFSAAGGSGSSDGGYRFGELPPGSYSVTVTAEGLRQQTALVRVIAGVPTRQNLTLRTGS